MENNLDNSPGDDVEIWLSIMEIGAPSAAERAAFEAWRAAHPAAAARYDEYAAICGDLRRLDSLRDASHGAGGDKGFEPAQYNRRGSPGRMRLSPLAAAAALGLIVAALAAWRLDAPFSAAERFETQTAEIRQVALSDRSVVDLAPQSAIRVAYSGEARRVELVAGEAFFAVSKADPRPFFVRAGAAEVRVVGTKFNVHRGPAGVTVAVAEGEVDIRRERPMLARALPAPRTQDNDERRLAAGQQALASSHDGVKVKDGLAPDQAGAWRSGFLVYGDNALREVVADINRYSPEPIIIASDDIADLRVVAAFPISRIDDTLSGLEGLLPVTIDRSDPGRIVIRAAASPQGAPGG